jgi:zinc D-Ala-D-Ala carboxypeptidase
MRLSEHFMLDELLESQTARRKGIDEQFNPSDEIKLNLQSLCIEVLDPLRKEVGLPIYISSGYRCKKLNRVIGGALNSQHIEGKASDIKVKGMNNFEIISAIRKAGIDFDQCIEEFESWVHISFNRGNNRNQFLKASLLNGKVVYSPLKF